MSPPVEIEPSALTDVVASAIGRPAIELGRWEARSIHAPFNQATGGLYRVAGTANDGYERISWSVILKVLHASSDLFGGATDPSDASYWAREALLFASGLLEHLPAIRAPRCFGVDMRADATARIWLEDVADHVGIHWAPPRYALAARRLGEFNGAYLVDQPLPTSPHVSRHWLRSSVEAFVPGFDRLAEVRDHPLVRRCWPGELLDQVVELWEERHVLLDALDALPQSFCHLDAFPRNLLINPATNDIVAVDWASAGIAAVGTELGPAVMASACVGDTEPDQLEAIERAVFDAYLSGLRAAGWPGDAETVRYGYAASAALHYGLVPLGVYLLDDRLRLRFERLFGLEALGIADHWAAISAFLVERSQEARRLLGSAARTSH